MNDDQRRKLTEDVLWEKWHEEVKQPPLMPEAIRQGYIQIALCACGKYSCDIHNRTFTTDTDVFDLMRRLVETGKWTAFLDFAIDRFSEEADLSGVDQFIEWLLLSVDPDGVRVFCRLVCEFGERDQ